MVWDPWEEGCGTGGSVFWGRTRMRMTGGRYTCLSGKHSQSRSVRPPAALQVYKRSFWTESFVQWSPKGSYVTTVHTRGVAVWGGPSFGRIQRFSHNQVCTHTVSFAQMHVSSAYMFPSVASLAHHLRFSRLLVRAYRHDVYLRACLQTCLAH